MQRFFSTTLGQILLVTACSSAATFVAFVALLFNPGSPPNPPWPWQTAYRIASVFQVLQSVPSSQRARLAATLSRPGYIYRIARGVAVCPVSNFSTGELAKALAQELHGGSGVSVHACSADDPRRDVQVLVTFADMLLEARTSSAGIEPPRFTVPFFAALAFLCVGVLATSAWALARVVRPLRRLAEQADAFGRDLAPEPIAEQGPLEIRSVARSFNRMQERVSVSLHSRTRTLAAISHDLRSPLTRMRLQIETNSGDGLRERLRRDIDSMQTMVSSVLAYLRTGAESEAAEWLDLGALMATLCDEYEETGAAIYYQGPDHLRLFCRPDAIRRALANLVDNALRYGQSVVLEATLQGGMIVIDICDDGPGIPEGRLQDVVEPFVRLDPARSGGAGSVGLGLAIVRDIVRAHGGEFSLANRQPSGLRARVVLPQEGT